jgi:TM2 domain-containing membrane protein YozV
MGLITLLTLLLQFILGYGITNPLIAYLGVGSTQILIIYPVILYLTALGGYLTSRGEDWVRLRFTKGYW